jgi:hypothetical protein
MGNTEAVIVPYCYEETSKEILFQKSDTKAKTDDPKVRKFRC